MPFKGESHDRRRRQAALEKLAKRMGRTEIAECSMSSTLAACTSVEPLKHFQEPGQVWMMLAE